ncbi:MAG: DUF4062 domain-containing protein [Lachnospiraceae bacterium]|nr:DUF4062 domain-containing protein [Lachnospiraceae bacterium]
MKEYRIFVASSTLGEFSDLRIRLADFFRQVNNILINDDKIVYSFFCEETSKAVAKSGKQNEINKSLKESDIFIAIFFDRFGEGTVGEVQEAVNSNIKYQGIFIKNVVLDEKGRTNKENLIKICKKNTILDFNSEIDMYLFVLNIIIENNRSSKCLKELERLKAVLNNCTN